LIICATITSILFALTKQRCVPCCSVLLILVSTVLIWVFVAISGSVSLILAKECNNGLDSLTQKYLINSDSIGDSVCVSTALNHYLFCKPWANTTVASCTNPIVPLEATFTLYIDIIKFMNNTQYNYLIPVLQSGLDTLITLDSCNDTIEVYANSKQDICFLVNNSLMQISMLYIIQSPILIVLLIYILFGWYRFHFQRLPYVLTDKSEEMGVMTRGSDTDDNSLLAIDPRPSSMLDESSLLLPEPAVKKPKHSSHTQSPQQPDMDKFKAILRKNRATIIFTGVLFLVVFVMIFVWFGVLNNAFKSYKQVC